jgi:glycosyltransferase involved in cell wall biosynthesis
VAVLEILLGILTPLALVPVSVLFVEVVMALLARRDSNVAQGKRPRVAALVPAHGVSMVIAQTVRCIVPQIATEDRLPVVDDNCSYDTAALAAATGATVIEHRETVWCGKAFALEFGIRHLEAHPADVVIVVDANCIVNESA